ncbi:hypothetical protein Trydic_g9483 [Trypoxylus dichotomus]
MLGSSMVVYTVRGVEREKRKDVDFFGEDITDVVMEIAPRLRFRFEPYLCDVLLYRSTPVPIVRPHEDEDSFPVICDRELHSLHRNVPALRRRDVDTAAIRQHYYPEGGWGWLVCGAAFLAHLLTSGVQLAFGLLYLYTMKFLVKKNQDRDFYVMATGK